MRPNSIRALRQSLILISSVLAAGALAADPAKDAVVGQVGHETIAFGQLESTIHATLDKQEQEHEAQLQQLNLSFVRSREEYLEAELGKLIDKRVLELEAASRKTTPDALAGAVKPTAVTDEQERALYESRKAEISKPFEQIEPQIKQYLEKQAREEASRKYLDSLRAKYKASVTMEPLREQVDATGQQRGPASAPVTIVEFSDFQCPYCGRFTPVLKQLLAAYPTQVRLVYRYYPLSAIHPAAQKAAEAAVCAGNQGKFWEMHDTLFAEQNDLGLGSLKEKAKRLGLDSKQFDDCLDGGSAAAVVAADVAAGQKLGIGSTPVTFVNGRYVNGAVTFEEMTALISDELHRTPSLASR